MANWLFNGIDRNGTARWGVISGDQSPADYTRSRWEQGWRSLKVRSNDGERHQVAGIAFNDTVGCRVWWAEDGVEWAEDGYDYGTGDHAPAIRAR